MTTHLQSRRLMALTVLFCLVGVGLGCRLLDLQLLRHKGLSRKAEQNTRRIFLRQPRRGDILDRRGALLATSTSARMICVDPSLLGNTQEEVAHALAPLLEISEAELRGRLLPRAWAKAGGGKTTNSCIVIKRGAGAELWERIQDAMTNLMSGVETGGPTERALCRNLRYRAVYALEEQVRAYPNHMLAAHVLGYATSEDRSEAGKATSELRGRDGIELYLDSLLRGAYGWELTGVDAKGREVPFAREQDIEPADGLNVVLTVDSVIQQILESALAEALTRYTPLSASGLVIRPDTGEVLAMATLPSFDPNVPGRFPERVRRNRVIADSFEPGSTFKAVVVAGALESGTVQLEDEFDCEHRRFMFAGHALTDHESYGMLTVEQIITHSSNIGAAKIGIKMGKDLLYDYIRNFGFGTVTGITLPSEASARALVHPPTTWSRLSIAQIPMGQGIGVTPLQMTMAICAIANDGWLMRPRIVDRLEDREGRVVVQNSSFRVRQVVSERTAKLMVQALKTVVGPGGTAPQAALAHYVVAGKTGTAQKAARGGYGHDKYVSSFIGFFPAERPTLCIAVLLDEPDPKRGYYGGKVAAPVFKQVAERIASYLELRPG